MPLREGVVTVGLVCEGPTDVGITTDLADRVIAEACAVTGAEVKPHRIYRGAIAGREFLAWHDVKGVAKDLGIRAHGHFDNQGVREPAFEDAQTTRKALLVFDRCKPRPNAVILVRDADRSNERRRGMEQARNQPGFGFQAIVIGVAETMRECWVICGFDPKDDQERANHQSLRQELGFDPCLRSHELTAKHEQDHRSAKRVLARLLQGDSDRERACWLEAGLQVLRERGDHNGLAAFVAELTQSLAPLFQ